MKKIAGMLFIITLLAGIVFNACRSTCAYYEINMTNCTLCNKCIAACGHHAIQVITSETASDQLMIDPDKCIGCGECIKVCSDGAIKAN